MTERNETRADIVAELRRDASILESRGMDSAAYSYRKYADRIEAAAKRERGGNEAKMREVLESTLKQFKSRKECDCFEDHGDCEICAKTNDLCWMEEAARNIRSALKAPGRNCDKPEFSSPEQAIAALKERFPIEAYFPGFKMAVDWMLDTTDYFLAEPVSRRFGQQPKEGGN